MKLLLRFFGFLFAAGTILFVVGIAAAAGLLWHFSKDLPDYSQLQDYEPPVMTRVHAADGSLVAGAALGMAFMERAGHARQSSSVTTGVAGRRRVPGAAARRILRTAPVAGERTASDPHGGCECRWSTTPRT